MQIRSEGKSYLKNQSLTELEGQLEAGAAFCASTAPTSSTLNVSSRIEQATKDSHVAILQAMAPSCPSAAAATRKYATVIQ